jgi:cytochrome P450
MSAVFFYLSRHPEVYRRLANEIRTTFADVEEIIHDPKLLRCTYLRACLEETLRISPPVGATLWRDVPAGDVPADADTNPVIIDGHVIPPGTQVGVNVYCIHHNEAYFASSFAFRPERWLPEESGLSAEETKVMNSAFLPFSKGPRNCAGVALAYTEASVVLAKTLWYFDFEIDEKDVASAEKNRPLVFHMEDQMGSWHTGPLLKFRPRGDAWRGL